MGQLQPTEGWLTRRVAAVPSPMALRDRLFDLHGQLNDSQELTAGEIRRVAGQLEQLSDEVAAERAAQEGDELVADLDALARDIAETLAHLRRWLAAYDEASHGPAG